MRQAALQRFTEPAAAPTPRRPGTATRLRPVEHQRDLPNVRQVYPWQRRHQNAHRRQRQPAGEHVAERRVRHHLAGRETQRGLVRPRGRRGRLPRPIRHPDRERLPLALRVELRQRIDCRPQADRGGLAQVALALRNLKTQRRAGLFPTDHRQRRLAGDDHVAAPARLGARPHRRRVVARLAEEHGCALRQHRPAQPVRPQLTVSARREDGSPFGGARQHGDARRLPVQLGRRRHAGVHAQARLRRLRRRGIPEQRGEEVDRVVAEECLLRLRLQQRGAVRAALPAERIVARASC